MPLYVREGGSLPVVPFLQKLLGVEAVHIPLGQASDNAHLPNERIRILNLSKGVSVLKKFLKNVSHKVAIHTPGAGEGATGGGGHSLASSVESSLTASPHASTSAPNSASNFPSSQVLREEIS